MAYIPDSDLNQDMLAAQFSSSFSTYHTLVDNHILELAEEEQVATANIATDDDGYIENKFLRRYAKYWALMHLFLDKMGINNNGLADEEKYRVKYEIYQKKVDEMAGRISYEMITNTIVSRMSTSSSGNIYRG